MRSLEAGSGGNSGQRGRGTCPRSPCSMQSRFESGSGALPSPAPRGQVPLGLLTWEAAWADPA